MDPFLGEIRAFAFGIVPQGWRLCDGSILQVRENQALFALLRNKYGGDGRTTFALPDLRGRAMLSHGVGPDGAEYVVGQSAGTEGVALTTGQMPAHDHDLLCSSQPGTTSVPQNNRLAAAPSGKSAYAVVQAPLRPMANNALANAGASAAHNNLQPSLAVNFCIATMGLFPSRS